MNGSAEQFQAILAAARTKFLAGLMARVEALEASVASARWEQVRCVAHKLRGAAGTYGYPLLADDATFIEQVLLDVSDWPGQRDCERILARTARVRAQAASAIEAG